MNNLTNAFFWTGATQSNISNGVTAWSDGTTIADAPEDVWKVGEPSGDGPCVAVYTVVKGMTNYDRTNNDNPILNGQWNDVGCSNTLSNPDGTSHPGGAVCKRSANPCGPGWSYFNKTCYYVRTSIF